MTARSLWIAALLGAVLAAGASHVFIVAHRWGPVDDAFITARYARNWAQGHGLCFNPGERVEGFSSFLLVVLEAAAARVGIDPDQTMRVISRGSLAVLGAVMGVLFFLLARPRHPVFAGLAGGALAANPALASWSASGMETVAFTVLLVAGIATALARREGYGAASAVIMAFAALLRPEGVAFVPLALVAASCQSRSRRFLVAYAAVCAGGAAAYTAWRVAYFGEMLPMPFFAKVDYGSPALARRGLRYVWAFARSSPLLTLGTLWVALRVRGSPRWVKVFLGAVAVNAAATIYVGGDHFPFFRFLIPSLPFLGVLTLHALWPIADGHPFRSVRGRLAAVIGVVIMAASGWTMAHASVRINARPLSHSDRFALESSRTRIWATIGTWLKATAPPGASLATIAIGAVGYYSDLRIIDPLGLIIPSIAHKRMSLGTGLAGHEKYDVDEVLARRPDYILAVHVPTPYPVSRSDLATVTWGEFNRKLARDARVDQAYRYVVLPWGRRYVNVFVRKDRPTPEAWGAPPPVGETREPWGAHRPEDGDATFYD